VKEVFYLTIFTSPPDPLSKLLHGVKPLIICLERGNNYERWLRPLSLRTPLSGHRNIVWGKAMILQRLEIEIALSSA
jgi:hypothetical protein